MAVNTKGGMWLHKVRLKIVLGSLDIFKSSKNERSRGGLWYQLIVHDDNLKHISVVSGNHIFAISGIKHLLRIETKGLQTSLDNIMTKRRAENVTRYMV
jgi:hypothetical protein